MVVHEVVEEEEDVQPEREGSPTKVSLAERGGETPCLQVNTMGMGCREGM